MNCAASVDRVAVRFGKIDAVAGISFAVDRGETFGLLGPNGVGKTTTLLLRKPAGSRRDRLRAAGDLDQSGADRAREPRFLRPRRRRLTYEVHGLRDLLLGIGSGESLWLDFTVCTGFFALAACIGARAYPCAIL